MVERRCHTVEAGGSIPTRAHQQSLGIAALEGAVVGVAVRCGDSSMAQVRFRLPAPTPLKVQQARFCPPSMTARRRHEKTRKGHLENRRDASAHHFWKINRATD